MDDVTMSEIAGLIMMSGGGSARLTTLKATENKTYSPPAGYDGFSEVDVKVAVTPRTKSLQAEIGKIYHASDYDCDGFTPVTAVGKTYDTLQDAYEDLTKTEVTADYGTQNVYIKFSAVFLANGSIDIKGGLADKSTGEFIQGTTGGTTLGANPKYARLVSWYIKNGVYWYDVEYANDTYPQGGGIIHLNTPIREAQLSNFGIDKVG